MVDTLDLKSNEAILREGSSPSLGTEFIQAVIQKYRNIFIVLAVIILLFFLIGFKNYVAQRSGMATVVMGGEKFNMQVASTAQDLEKGLGGEKSISNNGGMLFIFNKTLQEAFWMKDMEFSIDIIWLNNGVIVGIDKNASASANINDSNLPIYDSPSPINEVIEVKAGTANNLNLKTGDVVQINF